MSQPLVKVVGSGPDLVLIHGWGFHHGVWSGVLPKLAEHFKVHLVDIPGFGTMSAHPIADASIGRWADKIAQAVPKGAMWCGWSIGGMIAMQAAITGSAQVSKLITTGCNLSFCQRDDWAHAMKPSVLKGFKQSLLDDHNRTLKQFLTLQAMGADDAKAQVRLLKKQVFEHGQPHISALEDGLSMLQDVDLRSLVNQVNCPSLHLFGRLDALVPVKAVPHIEKAVPHSRTRVDAKSSHAPFISNPSWWLKQVLVFCADQSESSTRSRDVYSD